VEVAFSNMFLKRKKSQRFGATKRVFVHSAITPFLGGRENIQKDIKIPVLFLDLSVNRLKFVAVLCPSK